jgi:hypothetical protein
MDLATNRAADRALTRGGLVVSDSSGASSAR